MRLRTLAFATFLVLAVTDWRLRRWRLWFLALMTATRKFGSLANIVRRLKSIFFPWWDLYRLSKCRRASSISCRSYRESKANNLRPSASPNGYPAPGRVPHLPAEVTNKKIRTKDFPVFAATSGAQSTSSSMFHFSYRMSYHFLNTT